MKIINITNKPKGWDIADAQKDGLNLLSFIQENEQVVQGVRVTDKYILKCFYDIEKGDADLFVTLCSDEILYITTMKKWLAWRSGVWTLQNKNQIQNMILDIITIPYQELSFADDQKLIKLLKIEKEDLKDQVEKVKKFRVDLRDRVRNLKTKIKIKNVLEIVSWRLSVSIEEFDVNPVDINLKNGVYNLDNFTFRGHEKSDRFLKQAGVLYDEAATCEFTLNFFREIFLGNEELIDFIQKLFGIFLTGITDIQFFIYCYGKGKNGKTVFFKILKLLLGDYYHTVPIDTLLQKLNNSADEYQRAKFFGKRLIIASEIPENRKLNESQIKDLTGGESVSARQIYGEPFDFEPTFKLCLFGNHLLQISGTDEGIWRRVCLIPFNFTIPEDKKLPMSELEEKFKTELSGIFNWAIEGYKKYKQNGLDFPEIVTKTTNEYRDGSDLFKDFIDENFKFDSSAKTLISIILKRYQDWYTKFKYPISFQSSRQLIKELEDRDFKIIRGGAGNKTYIEGVCLK